jgi:hypothetical protein
MVVAKIAFDKLLTGWTVVAFSANERSKLRRVVASWNGSQGGVILNIALQLVHCAKVRRRRVIICSRAADPVHA